MIQSMNQLFRWSSAPSYLEWLQAYPATIACKNNETLSHCGDLFHVRAPLPPLTMLKTYYLISPGGGQEPLLQEGEGQ